MITNEHIDRFFERFDENIDTWIINRKYKIWNYFGNEEFNDEITAIIPMPACIEVSYCSDSIKRELDMEIILQGTDLYDHITSYFIAEKLKLWLQLNT